MTTDASAAPLAGVRVLDFSRVLAGPIVGRLFADLGADVVKAEPPEGDLVRYAHPQVNSISLYYAEQNCGKRNISLDLHRPEAVDICTRLAARADVVIENSRPGVMERHGLGYAALAAVNPRLVYGSISGYGQTGPWSDRRAYAVVVHAEAGLLDAGARWRRVAGDDDAQPVQDAMSHADVYAGLSCSSAVLAALFAVNAADMGSTSRSRWRRRCCSSTTSRTGATRRSTRATGGRRWRRRSRRSCVLRTAVTS